MSGAGKTRVIERAAELLGNAARLYFDHYASVSIYPANLKDWLQRGADLAEWQTPRLASDLRKLRSGEPIELPDARGIVEPAPFLLVEEPIGKSRREMAELIDLMVFLDVPADVLLARRLLRRLGEERESFGDRLLAQLHTDLHTYLSEGRDLFVVGDSMLRRTADVILDGMKTVEEISETLISEIRDRRGLASG
jgi:uridine kinase